MKKYTLFLLAIILLTGCSAGGTQFFTGKAEAERYIFYESIGGYYLPVSDFLYVDLIVPLDHTNPNDGRKTKVVFSVLPASGMHKGIFVVATGGPGNSALQGNCPGGRRS